MIALNKLTTGYISEEISKDLDLTIEKGTLVGVLGSNGIGKSTLLKTLAGFENPLNGTITIDGKDIHEMSPIDRAKNLSIVLTERSLSGDLLGKEVIQLGRQPYTNWIGSQKAKDRELVSETIEQMNIGALADRKLKTMSDGEIQKILRRDAGQGQRQEERALRPDQRRRSLPEAAERGMVPDEPLQRLLRTPQTHRRRSL